MAHNNVQTTVTVGMDVQLAKRNAEALKDVIVSLKNELKQQQELLDRAPNPEGYRKISAEIDNLILKIKTLQKVQRSATPAAAYEAFISGDVMNSNTLRQAQRGAKNRLNSVNEFAGDKEARRFIDDISRAQMKLNRLQAGFTKPLQAVKKELNSLSGGELQRLHQLLQQEQGLVRGNDKAWASYSVAIAKVEERMRQYDTAAKQAMGAGVLSQSQNGGFAQSNVRDIQRAIEKLREYRAVISDPNGAGQATWDATTREIQKLQSTLDALKRKTAEATGEAMSLGNAIHTGLQSMAGKFTGTSQQLAQAKKTLQAQLEITAHGTKQYEHLQRAIRGVEMEEKRMGMTAKEINAILNAPKGRSYNELKIAVEQSRMALANMRTTTEKEKQAFDELSAKVKEADFQMKELGNSSKGTASSFDKAWSRLKTYITLYMGSAVAMQKLSATMDDLLKLSDNMGEVRKTTDFTADEVGHLTENLKKLDTRTSINGLLELSAAAGQLGLSTQEDVQGFTEAANKLMVALPEMGREGATQMLKVALATGEIDKIQRQINEGSIRGTSAVAVAMEKVGSTIDRLRAVSSSAAPAITDFVQRVGAVGAQSGISIDQVAALGSTVDALGMRVEMSATAISRMIPAIRANAFDIAKVIGVTPDTLRNLFDTGRGMEAILMVLQHIKDNGMDADSVESMLGMGSMKEIMKELNQQGARAGIVFSGLSQNVDELRRQLGIAAEAYEQNVAIQKEYDKMNETTAAKWERLKNQVQEVFVGDSTQRFLGGIIDVMRALVDFIIGDVNPALQILSIAVKSLILSWAVFKLALGEAIFLRTASGIKGMVDSLRLLGMYTKEHIKLSWALATARTAEEKATIKATLAQKGLSKAMMANIWLAVAAAIAVACVELYNWIDAQKEGGREAAKFQAELQKEQEKVDKLSYSIAEARVKIEDANKEVDKTRAALIEAKKATDGTTESTKRLTDAETTLMKAEENKKKLMADHKQLINQFNSEYGKYLGFMLSEVSSNLELANARELVNDKLRESITLKRREAALERVEKEHGGDRDEAYATLYDWVESGTKKDYAKRALIMNQLTTAAHKSKDQDEFRSKAENIIPKDWGDFGMGVVHKAVDYYKEVEKINQKNQRIMEQTEAESSAHRGITQNTLRKQANAAIVNYKQLRKKYNSSKGDNKKQAAADLLKEMDTLNELMNNAGSHYDLNNPREAASYKNSFTNMFDPFVRNQNKSRNKLLKEAGNLYQPRTTLESISGSGANGSFADSKKSTTSFHSNMWGDKPAATSTQYGDWDVDELVARRNQMDKFKNVLKPGVDVRAVLAEDKALMKALDNGLKSDWKSVLDWYNEERKKIQKELKDERFSTNAGHWRDEETKNGRKRVNPLSESDYALAELDRYYLKRQKALEEARGEEKLSEEMFNRQTELLEQEHLERRAKLRGSFTGKIDKASIKEFREWWEDREKLGDLDNVPWATVESEWAKARENQIGRNNKNMAKDMTDMAAITRKHVNEIAKIVSEERPYDGITDNLRENLTKLDVLFADLKMMDAKQIEENRAEQNRRLSFLLGEAENAYTLTPEQLMEDMRREGFDEWVNALNNPENGEELKRRMLAQLRTAYDAVQDAIKKEASQIKKQADIWWADIPTGQEQSRRDGYENVLGRLGLEEEQIKRANQLIGAGYASESVANKLAIKQMQIRLDMQQTYYNKMREIGLKRINQLQEEANLLRQQGKIEEARQIQYDADHLRSSLNLATAEEGKKILELQNEITLATEESQARLYTHLQEWFGLFTSSLQSVFEASNAGAAEYYNERAKLELTGKGGPGAGTYVVIDHEGTSDATAHYEYLDEREALERQREIERSNALADAWKKVFDDFSTKLNDYITDELNAMLQTASLDANTEALIKNTEALTQKTATDTANVKEVASNKPKASVTVEGLEGEFENTGTKFTVGTGMEQTDPMTETQKKIEAENALTNAVVQNEQVRAQAKIDADTNVTNAKILNNLLLKENEINNSNEAKDVITNNKKEEVDTQGKGDKENEKSSKKTFAAMTAAANMYGIAYQAMSNENLNTAQKVQMMIVQAAGQALISMLTAEMAASTGKTSANAPSWISKTLADLGPIGGPVAVGIFTAMIGGLMGLATSKISKSKSQIAQATGASASAGRLSTGMLTYAEGNVNEFTDPASLTPGRQYNVDGADGRTYRARYMGNNPRTHITNGPEFHLAGERGREMIIDAGTTRQITMNENEIWRAIQTLSGGGSLRRAVKRGRGVATFADGNVSDFSDFADYSGQSAGTIISPEQAIALQSSIERQNELLERALTEGIKGVFNVHGPDGLVANYDRGKKTANRHGERY